MNFKFFQIIYVITEQKRSCAFSFPCMPFPIVAYIIVLLRHFVGENEIENGETESLKQLSSQTQARTSLVKIKIKLN